MFCQKSVLHKRCGKCYPRLVFVQHKSVEHPYVSGLGMVSVGYTMRGKHFKAFFPTGIDGILTREMFCAPIGFGHRQHLSLCMTT